MTAIAASFSITQGDMDPALVVAMRQAGGVPYTPGPGSSATFKMKRRSDGHVVTGAATVGGGAGDQLTYIWAPGDTDKPGLYDAQFKVIPPDGRPVSFPTFAGPCAGCAPGALTMTIEIVPSL